MPRHGNDKWDAAWSRALSEGAPGNDQASGRQFSQELERAAAETEAGIIAPNNIIAPSNIIAPNNADGGETPVAQEMEHGIIAPSSIIAPNNVSFPAVMNNGEEEDFGGPMISGLSTDLLVAKTPSPGGPIPIPYPAATDGQEDAIVTSDFGFLG